jgi:hypothetical protein
MNERKPCACFWHEGTDPDAHKQLAFPKRTDSMTGHKPALRNLLTEWVRISPWERQLPADGEVLTVDDGWECYVCPATMPWDENNLFPNSGDGYDLHPEHCLWKRSIEALSSGKYSASEGPNG